MFRSAVTVVCYYLALGLVAVAGGLYGFYFSELFFPDLSYGWLHAILEALKLSWLVPFPYALLNYYSFLRYPIYRRAPLGASAELLPVRLYCRFVTRGRNPHLSLETLQAARQVLEAVLPADCWRIEVVSDNPLAVSSADGQARLILVPDDFQTSLGTRYKARALHFALVASDAGDDDWIVHLDEETRFDEDTVRRMWQFVQSEARGPLCARAIGQGIILYGAGPVVNWLTTLADSIRVGDDYGRFRLQFEQGKAWFGMHGSFIVINNGLEKSIGFDHGFAGSITEDAYFALLAQASGYRFRFVHAFMYEKSPFSVRDFVLQRRRWFGGLWLCARDRAIPLADRVVLATFMAMWSTCWLSLLMVYLNFILPTGTPLWLAMIGGISFSYYVLLYLVGFFHTFPGRLPWPLLLVRMLQQILLIPVFSLLEGAGVIYGLLAPPRDFYIVQKELDQPRRRSLPVIALPPGLRRRYQGASRQLAYAWQALRFAWLARRWNVPLRERAGVYTAAFWQRAVARRLERLAGTPSSVLTCTLDGLEPLIHTHDPSLVAWLPLEIGALVAQRVRASDLVCRAGPDRLAVALFGCPAARAEQIAAEINADLGRTALSQFNTLYGIQLQLTWEVVPLPGASSLAVMAALLEPAAPR